MAIRLPCPQQARNRHWRLRAAFSLAILCTAARSGRAADHPDYTVRAHAEEVRVTFSVLDQHQHAVPNLRASDFVVVDKDYIVRNFQSFKPADWKNVDLAVLVDTSGSMTPRFRQEIAQAIELLRGSDTIPKENISVFSFRNLAPTAVCAGNCLTEAALRLPQLSADGQTPLYDSISFAADALARQGDAQTQKILILFSDGEDTISRNSLQQAVTDVMRSGIQAYAIDLSPSPGFSHGSTVLKKLAQTTGGRYLQAKEGVSPALRAILDAFHTSYTVTYRLPSQDHGFHTIQIFPTHNVNLQFRSRSGYFYPDSNQEEQ